MSSMGTLVRQVCRSPEVCFESAGGVVALPTFDHDLRTSCHSCRRLCTDCWPAERSGNSQRFTGALAYALYPRFRFPTWGIVPRHYRYGLTQLAWRAHMLL